MPYAPGVDYEAGRIFAAMGPRINENIQTFMNHRRDRQQMTATAEMLGRYIAKDPQAMEMFGEDLAKIPDMSLGKAKGTLGGLTAYLTQRHLDAAEAAQKQSLDIAQKNQELLAGEAAQRLQQQRRMQDFSERVAREVNPPLMYKSAVGRPDERPGITSDTLARLAAESGTLADPGTATLLSAVGTNQHRASGLPIGRQFKTEEGDVITGMGLGVPPNIRAPKEGLPIGRQYKTQEGDIITGMGIGVPPNIRAPKEGLPLGESRTTDEGDRIIGMGVGVSPHIVSAKEAQNLSPLDQSFLMFSPVYSHQLDGAEKTIKEYGTGFLGGAWGTNPKGVALMKQLPEFLANSFAKLVDPSGVVRETDVERFRKQLFPQGPGTRVSVTLAAIDNLRTDAARRVQTWSVNRQGKAQGKVPENLPPWVQERIKSFDSAPSKSPSTGADGDLVSVYSPTGEIGDIPKSKLEEALKKGYRRAQ